MDNKILGGFNWRIQSGCVAFMVLMQVTVLRNTETGGCEEAWILECIFLKINK